MYKSDYLEVFKNWLNKGNIKENIKQQLTELDDEIENIFYGYFKNEKEFVDDILYYTEFLSYDKIFRTLKHYETQRVFNYLNKDEIFNDLMSSYICINGYYFNLDEFCHNANDIYKEGERV